MGEEKEAMGEGQMVRGEWKAERGYVRSKGCGTWRWMAKSSGNMFSSACLYNIALTLSQIASHPSMPHEMCSGLNYIFTPRKPYFCQQSTDNYASIVA